MRKGLSFTIGICLLLLLLAGCRQAEPDRDAILIDRKEKVTRIFADTFEYDEAEIRSMMEEELEEYNSRFGTEHVQLADCTLKDGVLRIRIVCDEPRYYEDYCSYYNDDFATEERDVELYVGPLSGADGYDFSGNFVDPEGTAADLDEIFSESKARVAIFNEPVEIYVPGRILFVSDNVEISGKKQAKRKESEEPLERAYVIYM